MIIIYKEFLLLVDGLEDINDDKENVGDVLKSLLLLDGKEKYGIGDVLKFLFNGGKEYFGKVLKGLLLFVDGKDMLVIN